MSNRKHRITIFAAAVMLSLAPAAVYADSIAGSAPASTPAANHAQSGKEHPSHPHHAHGFRAGGYFIVNETAKLLEMDRSELIAGLHNGKTLYSIAKEKKGWSEDQYIQKLSSAASLKLDQSVKDGQISADEANKLKAGLPALLKLSIRNAGLPRSGSPSEQHSRKNP